MKIPRFLPICLGFGLAALAGSSLDAQVVLADSQVDFSGVQGQDDWHYGFRNLTLDGGTVDSYDPVADFIEFLDIEFDGAKWDLGANAPWTEVGVANVHPNGTNNGEEHWAIRRWVAPAAEVPSPTLVQVDWTVAKVNPGGTGVTGQLHLNGNLVDSAALAGNDTVGAARSVFITISADDIIDLACTPVGLGGDPADGADGSRTSMIISTVLDTDSDGLPDAWEEIHSPGDLTVLAAGSDADGDTLNDEEELSLGTSPVNADTDGDGYNDKEEIDEGSNPVNASSMPLALALAESRSQFSDVQGQDGWNWGYRNYTTTGGTTDYDPVADFTPFLIDGSGVITPDVNHWNSTNSNYRLVPSNAPWTFLSAEGNHPNGTNSAPNEEHWTIRRWTASGLGGTTPLRVIWHTRKTNLANDGVTGSLHLNGEQLDTQTIAGNDGTGFIRTYYLNVDNDDVIDLVLTPEGVTNRTDGSDGSANWMWIDDRIPSPALQPDGSVFVPAGSGDSDGDGLPDAWEEAFFPGDLTKLASGSDFDGDSLNDEDEEAAGTDPTNPDSDGDFLTDGEEAALGTDPRSVDTDGDGLTDEEEVNGIPSSNPLKVDTDDDGFSDPDELAEGTDPNDPASNLGAIILADSFQQFSDTQGQDGWEWGYRNVTQDGKGTNYDPLTDFIPFLNDGTGVITPDVNHWNSTNNSYRLVPANAPWTTLGQEANHPNGTNSAPNEEHWTVRRWTASGLAGETPVALIWHMRKTNPNGTGVTGSIHVNGEQIDTVAIAGGDNVGFVRTFYTHLNNDDIVDLILSPVGNTGDTADGSDGSANWLRIDPRIPAVPIQPNGKFFVPNGSEDSDGDGLADFVEIDLVGNIVDLDGSADDDGDGISNADELLVYCTDLFSPDSDGDGLADGVEINTHGTDPANNDTDGDSWGDFHEIATGHDPLDAFSSPDSSFFDQIADSRWEYPSGEPSPQGAVNNWSYGYYNITQDGEPPLNTNFIEFLTDGSFDPSTTNQWDGVSFDFFDDLGATVNPPWTQVGNGNSPDAGHPNGDNNGDIHWAVRRWTAGGFFDAPGPLLLHYFLAADNPNGTGTTAILLHNGKQIDSITVAGNDQVGRTSWSYIDATPGDTIEVALSPLGTDGLNGDGADGSFFWMIVDTAIPANPLQPDGNPFVSGGGGGQSRLLAIDYNGNLTLRWSSSDTKEYQVQESTDLQNWSNIGPTIAGSATGETETTIIGAPAPPRYYRVLELEP